MQSYDIWDMRNVKERSGLFGLAYLGMLLLMLYGWGTSVRRAFNSDWSSETSYKREVIYTIGSVIPPVGGVVGIFTNVKD